MLVQLIYWPRLGLVPPITVCDQFHRDCTKFGSPNYFPGTQIEIHLLIQHFLPFPELLCTHRTANDKYKSIKVSWKGENSCGTVKVTNYFNKIVRKSPTAASRDQKGRGKSWNVEDFVVRCRSRNSTDSRGKPNFKNIINPPGSFLWIRTQNLIYTIQPKKIFELDQILLNNHYQRKSS